MGQSPNKKEGKKVVKFVVVSVLDRDEAGVEVQSFDGTVPPAATRTNFNR